MKREKKEVKLGRKRTNDRSRGQRNERKPAILREFLVSEQEREKKRKSEGKIKMPSSQVGAHTHARIEETAYRTIVNTFECVHMLTIINVTKDIQKGKSNK